MDVNRLYHFIIEINSNINHYGMGLMGAYFGLLILSIHMSKSKVFTRNICNYIIFSIVTFLGGHLVFVLNLKEQGLLAEKWFIFYVGIFGLIIISALFKFFLFKNYSYIGIKVLRSFLFLCFGIIFTLGILGKLKLDILCVLCWDIVVLYSAVKVIKLYIKKKNENVTTDFTSDIPNDFLFPDRQRQLDYFKLVLEEHKDEPYGIMISGEWGVGKSSFVAALQKQLAHDHFITIQAGSEKSVEQIMKNISEQILDILYDSGVYVEHRSIVEKYFSAFGSVLHNNSFVSISNMLELFCSGRRTNEKEYLNSNLNKLDGMIYLLVEDLDRCEKNYQIKMFKVLRESLELVHCKCLFVVDKNVFLKDVKKKYKDYVDKYFSYTLDLCEVKTEAVVEYYVNYYFDDSYIDGLSRIVLKKRTNDEFRKEIIESMNKIREKIKSTDIKIQEKKPKSDEEGFWVKGQVDKNLVNPRKIKRYLKGIKVSLKNISPQIQYLDSILKDQEWLEVVRDIEWVKYMIPLEYEKMKSLRRIADYPDNAVKKYLLGIDDSGFMSALMNNKEQLINYIIYELDTIDFLEIRTEEEKYMTELNGSNATTGHILEYLNYAISYKDYTAIIDFCSEKRIKDDELRYSTLVKVLEVFEDRRIVDATIEEIYELSKKFREYLKVEVLNIEDQKLCIRESEIIIRSILVKYVMDMRKILYLFLSPLRVNSVWNVTNDYSIDLICEYLRQCIDEIGEQNHDEELRLMRLSLSDSDNKYDAVKSIFDCMYSQAKGEEQQVLEGLNKTVGIVCDMCKLWDELEENIVNTGKETNKAFSQYFYNRTMAIREEKFFKDISNLLQALTIFYGIDFEDDQSFRRNYSGSFRNILVGIIEQNEKNKGFFEGKEHEVLLLINKIDRRIHQELNLNDSALKGYTEEIRFYMVLLKKRSHIQSSEKTLRQVPEIAEKILDKKRQIL